MRRLVDDKVLPVIGEHFENATFPQEIIPDLAQMGLFGMHLHGYGCAGLSSVASTPGAGACSDPRAETVAAAKRRTSQARERTITSGVGTT